MACLPFEFPSSAVTASFNGDDFAGMMDKAFSRSAKVIEYTSSPKRYEAFEEPRARRHQGAGQCPLAKNFSGIEATRVSAPEGVRGNGH